jgi:hypothetical protein
MMARTYLLMCEDGVIYLRVPQPVAPDLRERMVGVGVAEPAPAPVHSLHDRRYLARNVVHIEPRLKGRAT